MTKYFTKTPLLKENRFLLSGSSRGKGFVIVLETLRLVVCFKKQNKEYMTKIFRVYFSNAKQILKEILMHVVIEGV